MTRPVVEVLGAQPAAHTAAPASVLRLRIAIGGGRVHAATLRVHVQLNVRRRRYSDEERRRLYELFGGEADFARMLRPITWAQSTLVLAGFDAETTCDLALPCTYDLEVASAKYLHAIRDGYVPLTLMFSGTIFRLRDGALSVEQLPWDVDAPFAMPAGVWRAAMDRFFPGGGWLRLQQDTIDRLQAFRGQSALVSWDATIDALLAQARGGALAS
jgi:hypothetical protein